MNAGKAHECQCLFLHHGFSGTAIDGYLDLHPLVGRHGIDAARFFGGESADGIHPFLDAHRP